MTTITPTPHTVREVVLNIAVLVNEQSSDDPPNTAACYTSELDSILLGSEFRMLRNFRYPHRALLHILRAAIDTIPAEAETVQIVSSYQTLIRIGSSGDIPTSHKRFWREVRKCLAPYEVVWKLAPEDDERQLALVRCLRALLADHTLAGPRLVTASRRARKAAKKPPLPNALSADDAICAHNHTICKVEASPDENVVSLPQSQAEAVA
jgi:hypothetical protein